MKANELRLEELVRFSTGLVHMHGRRLILFDMHAMGQFQADLVKSMGGDEARRILTRMGYFWGQADASAISSLFVWDSFGELIKSFPRMLMMQGFSKTELNIIDLDEAGGGIHLESTWHDRGEAQDFIIDIGDAVRGSCWMHVGYASGFTSYVMGETIYFIETECRADGDSRCRAIGRPAGSWGDELALNLRYFNAGDIEDRIAELAGKLDIRTREMKQTRQGIFGALEGESISSSEIRSRRFEKIIKLSSRVAEYDSSVLITGETGTGKEVLARYIHDCSPRAGKSFVVVNCAALTDTLLDSELFGHVAGAFTGAVSDKQGLFEEADGGTILLDEIGDMSPGTQKNLLRVLQEHTIRPVGATVPKRVDVRVMAATNTDLGSAVERGDFRQDLFYRLKVIHIDVPPLRERREDILPLARKFVKRFAGEYDMARLVLDATCIDMLSGYHWPGNIRELENAVEHAAVLSGGRTIKPEHFPKGIAAGGNVSANGVQSLEEVELKHIAHVLDHTGGNRTRAAELLGVSVATLYRKLKKIAPGETGRS